MKEQTCCCPHFPPAQQTQNCMCWVVGSFWYAAAEEPEAFLSPHSLLQYHCQNKWTFGDALFLLWHLTTITCIYQALFCCLLSHIHLQFALPQSLTANLLRKCIPSGLPCQRDTGNSAYDCWLHSCIIWASHIWQLFTSFGAHADIHYSGTWLAELLPMHIA